MHIWSVVSRFTYHNLYGIFGILRYINSLGQLLVSVCQRTLRDKRIKQRKKDARGMDFKSDSYHTNVFYLKVFWLCF